MFAKSKREEIKLGPNDISVAKDILPYTDKLITRQRSFVSYLGMIVVFEKLKKLKVESTFSYTLANNALILNEFDVADIWANDVKIDVRVSVSEDVKQIAIPKSHFEFNMAPDIYVAVNFNKYLDEAEVLGIIKTNEINLSKSDEYSYFVDVEDLTPFSDIKKIMKQVKIKENILNVSFGEISELFLPYIDNEINKTDKQKLLNALSKSIDFMDAFNVVYSAEKICSKLPKPQKKQKSVHQTNIDDKDYTLAMFAGGIPVNGPVVNIDISDDIHTLAEMKEEDDFEFFGAENKDTIDAFLNQEQVGSLPQKKKLFKTLNGMFKEVHEETLENENFDFANLGDELMDFEPVENENVILEVPDTDDLFAEGVFSPEPQQEDAIAEVSLDELDFLSENIEESPVVETKEELFFDEPVEVTENDELILQEEEDIFGFAEEETVLSEVQEETRLNVQEDIFLEEFDDSQAEELNFEDNAEDISFEMFEAESEAGAESQIEEAVEVVEIADFDSLDFLSDLADVDNSQEDESGLFEQENPQGVQIAGLQESFSDDDNIYEQSEDNIDDIFKNSKRTADEKRQVVDPRVMQMLLDDEAPLDDTSSNDFEEKYENSRSLFNDDIDRDNEENIFDSQEEVVSNEKPAGNKFGLVAALLATVGIAGGYFAWQQSAQNSAVDPMAINPNGINPAMQSQPGMPPSGNSTAPSVDVNQSLANAVAPVGDTVNISSVQWEVNSVVAGNEMLNKFLIISGRTLKQSLASELSKVTEKAPNSFVKLNLIIDSTGTVSSKMITGSGSSQIDAAILKTVKETFSYSKMPNAGPEISSINSNLIINL